MGVARRTTLALLLCAVSPGLTEAGPGRRAKAPRAAAPGGLSARGAAAADLRAPSARVARIRAERAARGRAEARLRNALAERGLSGKRAETVLAGATVSDRRFGSDGSVEVELTVAGEDLPAGKRR